MKSSVSVARWVVVLFSCSAFEITHGFRCNGELNYLYTVEDNCSSYYECKKGSTIPTIESCFWFIRQFNPETLSCDWFWRVSCTASPPPIPTAFPPTSVAPSTVTSSSLTTSNSDHSATNLPKECPPNTLCIDDVSVHPSGADHLQTQGNSYDTTATTPDVSRHPTDA